MTIRRDDDGMNATNDRDTTYAYPGGGGTLI